MKRYYVLGYILLSLGLLFTNQILKEIIIYNKEFLLSNYRIINFDYKASHLNGILPDGDGELIIGKDQYRLSLRDQIYHSQNNIWKKYIPNTNQLIIETANSTVDSILFTIFDYDFIFHNLNEFYNYNILSIEEDILYSGVTKEDLDIFVEIFLSTDFNQINQVKFYDENVILLDIYDITISSSDSISIDAIQLNIKNPFILDLRE